MYCIAPAWAASPVVSVHGESTYYDNGTHSRVECERLASEQARIDALAREFGTIVSQDIVQTDRERYGVGSNDFLMLSSTEVKGEWIADSAEPQYEYSYDKTGNLIVSCKVTGTARAIQNDAVAFEALALRNGIDRRNADTRFKDGDELYLLVNPSADGYIAVFLEDESHNVYGLLPYPRDSKNELKLRRNREYVFFDASHDKGECGPVEELVLTASDGVEYNRLYVVYSPNSFAKPVMTGTGLPSVDSKEFAKWLAKSRRNDAKMGVKAMNLEILSRD